MSKDYIQVFIYCTSIDIPITIWVATHNYGKSVLMAQKDTMYRDHGILPQVYINVHN